MDDGCHPLPFTLRQLQYVVAIEDTGGFSRAAEHCRVSQPSLSAQVAQLEEALGVQIFERARRGVVVTTAGRAVLEQARTVLRMSADLERVAQSARDPWSATWRFGIIPTLASYILPTLAPALGRAHDGLKVVWREATTPELVEALSAGRLEAAVLALEADLGSLETCPVLEDPFLLAVGSTHRLATFTEPVGVDALDDEQLLLLEDGHCLRDQALEVCRRTHPDGEGFEATSLATLIEMVAVGEGVTLLPVVATRSVSRDPRISLLEFEAPAPFRTIGLAWRSSSTLGDQFREVARLFGEGLRAAAALRNTA